MRGVIAGLVWLLCMAPALATSPFDGVWKADTGAMAPSARPLIMVLRNGIFSCLSCAPPLSIKADGRMHAIVGDPTEDEISITIVGADTITEIDKLHGRVVSMTSNTLSLDGNSLRTSWTDLSGRDGKAIVGGMVQRRVAPAPPGAHPISGGWQPERLTHITDSAMTVRLALGDGKFSYRLPSGLGYEAVVGGDTVPLQGAPEGTMVKVTMPTPDTIVETDLRDGHEVHSLTLTVAADGRTIHQVVRDQAGSPANTLTLVRQ